MATLADLVEELIMVMKEMQTVTLGNAAAMSLVIYDTILTFPRELTYIWMQKWTLAKVLYIFCRYYATVAVSVWFFMYAQVQHSVERCRNFGYFAIAGQTIVVQFVLNVIIILRLYALYGRSKILLATLMALFLGDTVGELYVAVRLAQSSAKAIIIVPFGIPLSGCLIQFTALDNTFTTWIWGLAMSLNFILFGLMMIKYVEHLRKHRISGDAGSIKLSLTPILKAFYKTGTVWYFTETMIVMIHVIVYYRTSGITQLLMVPWISVVQSISGTRLVLNLRESDYKERTANGSTLASPHPLPYTRPSRSFEKRSTSTQASKSFLDLE